MLKKIKGFSLIELLLYLLIFSMLAVSVFGFFTVTQKWLIVSNAKTEKTIRNVIALDLFKRDLMGASRHFCDWDISKQDLVFKKVILDKKRNERTSHVGWRFGDDGAIRIEGEYDFKNKTWNSKQVSRANYKMEKIDIEVNGDKAGRFIDLVELKCEKQASYVVCLRDRVVTR